MQTKVVRITPEAEAVALQYGRTVSDGIMQMEMWVKQSRDKPVTDCNAPVTKCNCKPDPTVTEMLQKVTSAVTSCNNWKPDPAYWAQLRDEVRVALGKPAYVSEFKPASQIRTIGKIDPSEQIQEPIGRQGRDVR